MNQDVLSGAAPDLVAFHSLFDSVARFGATPAGGLHRLAASAEEGLARDCVCAWLTQRGFSLRVDPAGNIFACLALAGDDAPWVLTGSHLDSQPGGGRFDGALGVVAACVAVDAIARAQGMQFHSNLGVAIWTNEEGARFAPSMLGSGVFAGQYDFDFARRRMDADGVTLAQALALTGYDGQDRGPEHVAAYVELHIEQGPELERNGATIGVVRGNWGTNKYLFEINGVAAHTGPTPMSQRRDALLAASHLVIACRALSDATEGRLLTSVGRMDIHPNSSNVIAARVTVYAELRCTDNSDLQRASRALEVEARRIGIETGTTIAWQQVTDRPAGNFDDALCRLIAQVAFERGLKAMDLHTVAGHDSVSLRARCPTAMIFVPSKDGVSHNEAEFTGVLDLEAGVEVLCGVLARLVALIPDV